MAPELLLIHNSWCPKVTEINPWIYIQIRFLKACSIQLCLLYVFQIFSIILWSETSFLFIFNIHLVFFFVCLFSFFLLSEQNVLIVWWTPFIISNTVQFGDK